MHCFKTEETAFDWRKYFAKSKNNKPLNWSSEKLPTRKFINGREYESIKLRSIELPDYHSKSKHTSQDLPSKSPLVTAETDGMISKSSLVKFPKYFMYKDFQKVERERDMRHMLLKSIHKGK